MYYNDYNRTPDMHGPIETNRFYVSPPQPPKKKKHLGLKIVAGCLVCALAGGIVGGGGVLLASGRLGLGGGSTIIYEGAPTTSAVTVAQVDGQTALTPDQIYAANLESVVGINGNVTTNVFGRTVANAVSGSGFVISADGYILTNYHVIDGVNDITVSFADGTRYDAVVVGGESANDIAVLKIEAEGLRPVVLGSSDRIRVGESVVSIGNPLGELTFTLTAGCLSAKDRSITMSDNTVVNMLQTDAAINSGNSGGPLFDQYGQVIGIVSAKYSGSSGTSAAIEGIGFAIPIDDVASMITSIIENGYVTGKPNLGVLLGSVDSVSQRYGIPAGASILAVLEGSCADKAGIQVDDIITAVDGTAVTSTSEAQAAVKKHQAGDSVTFTIYRDGAETTVTVTLDEDNQERAAAMNELNDAYTAAQQDTSDSYSGGYDYGGYGNGWSFGGWPFNW